MIPGYLEREIDKVRLPIVLVTQYLVFGSFQYHALSQVGKLT